jgi:hypothetical protein
VQPEYHLTGHPVAPVFTSLATHHSIYTSQPSTPPPHPRAHTSHAAVPRSPDHRRPPGRSASPGRQLLRLTPPQTHAHKKSENGRRFFHSPSNFLPEPRRPSNLPPPAHSGKSVVGGADFAQGHPLRPSFQAAKLPAPTSAPPGAPSPFRLRSSPSGPPRNLSVFVRARPAGGRARGYGPPPPWQGRFFPQVAEKN